jgi:ketosteroid isomerase-like protein
MPASLPRPIAAYFAATNRFDIDATLAPFAAAAVVEDEGQQRRGRPAIRAWLEEVTARYRATVEVAEIAEAGGRTVVTGLVSGTFPGSPARLRYSFALAGDEIAALEIR